MVCLLDCLDFHPAAEQPESESAGVPVTVEEMIDILYKPQEGEWGDRGRDQESARIIAGIEQLVTVGTFDFAVILLSFYTVIYFYQFCAFSLKLHSVTFGPLEKICIFAEEWCFGCALALCG